MPSTKQAITRDRMLGGANMTERPHLVEDSQWTKSHNMRSVNSYIDQVPHKVLITASGSIPEPVTALIAIPTEVRGECIIVALGDTRASVLTPVSSGFSVTTLYNQEMPA